MELKSNIETKFIIEEKYPSSNSDENGHITKPKFDVESLESHGKDSVLNSNKTMIGVGIKVILEELNPIQSLSQSTDITMGNTSKTTFDVESAESAENISRHKMWYLIQTRQNDPNAHTEDLLATSCCWELLESWHYGIWWFINGSISLMAFILSFTPDWSNHQILSSIALAYFILCVVIREDIVLNILYYGCYYLPLDSCTSLKYHVLRMLNCIGGLHSSSACLGILWTVYYLIHEYTIKKPDESQGEIVTLALVMALLIAIAITAHPNFRYSPYGHDLFESCHRYCGWAAVVMIIIHVIVAVKYEVHSVIIKVDLYLAIGMVFLLVLPWTYLQRATIICRYKSEKTLVLEFPETERWYLTRSGAGKAVRICSLDHSFLEFHSFAVIPNENSNPRTFYCVISTVGDWTKKFNSACKVGQERTVYVRGWKAAGFMHLVQCYKNVIFVATGGGLAPCLPYINDFVYHKKNKTLGAMLTNIFVLWSKPEDEDFGDIGTMMTELERQGYAVIINTPRPVRPPPAAVAVASTNGTTPSPAPAPASRQRNVASSQLSHTTVYAYNLLVRENLAEAVFVVSGKGLTDDVVNNCRRRNIPAYGAIFDS